MTPSFRSAVLTAPGKVILQSQPALNPGPTQVRVKLEGCGVCGSNLPLWEGRPWFSYPMPPGSPGHEGWGIVDRIGSDTEGFRHGDRVAMLSYHSFAEYDLAESTQLMRLPDELDGMPFPGEALGCAMNVFRRADILPGQRVAIIGIGFLGAVLTELASQTGAIVIAISRRDFALKTATAMGASYTISLDDHQAVRNEVNTLTNDEGCERVIEATGQQHPLDLASHLVAERGKLVIAGYHQDGLREVNMQLWNWRGIDVINAHERDPKVYLAGMQAAADAIASGKLHPDPLYTHHFCLDGISNAFQQMADRTGPFMKSLISYD